MALSDKFPMKFLRTRLHGSTFPVTLLHRAVRHIVLFPFLARSHIPAWPSSASLVSKRRSPAHQPSYPHPRLLRVGGSTCRAHTHTLTVGDARVTVARFPHPRPPPHADPALRAHRDRTAFFPRLSRLAARPTRSLSTTCSLCWTPRTRTMLAPSRC